MNLIKTVQKELTYSKENLKMCIDLVDYKVNVYATAIYYSDEYGSELDINELEVSDVTCIDEDGNKVSVAGNELKMVEDKIYEYLNDLDVWTE